MRQNLAISYKTSVVMSFVTMIALLYLGPCQFSDGAQRVSVAILAVGALVP